ncbi:MULTISPECIES: hypothetical protein [unclassified Paenibacillus]|uniref:hypothetical protein n=1 Tax=unclassified Paenibacillus TaxID=185978 RepID=UPI001C11FB96|nr:MULTISPECIES: hypothetical protein [unclassified Paenibacillus]MBU5443536.1 hypothetical protein [Paenibacillus sp. MSJ-34]
MNHYRETPYQGVYNPYNAVNTTGLVPYAPPQELGLVPYANPAPVQAPAAAAPKAGGFPNLGDLKGIIDRMGGIEGIVSTMGKVQKIMSSVQQMAPVMRLMMDMFLPGKAKVKKTIDPEVDKWRPRRRRRRRAGSSTRRRTAGRNGRQGQGAKYHGTSVKKTNGASRKPTKNAGVRRRK